MRPQPMIVATRGDVLTARCTAAAVMHTIPVQLLAYRAALARGTDVDKLRNLAKSVTVE